MSDWQPISTAPIDQGCVLLSDGDEVTLGWWSEVDAVVGEHEAVGGWAFAGGVAFTFEPTHWMPLPPPPNEEPK